MTNLPSIEEARRLVNDTLEKMNQKLIDINEHIDGTMTNLPLGEESRRLVNDTLEKMNQKLKEEYQE